MHLSFKHQRDRKRPGASLQLATFYGRCPGVGLEAEAGHAFRVYVPRVEIRLHLAPIVLPSPIAKRCWRGLQRAAFDGFCPSGMAKAEAFRALDKTVPRVMIGLHDRPIVNLLWHEESVARLCANRMALNQYFQQVAAPLTPNKRHRASNSPRRR